MLNRSIRTFISGFIVACLLMLSFSSMAEEVSRSIDVAFNKINLKVNGSAVAVDNMLFNGTTYAPVRAVAEMLGKEVLWDSSTNSANISDKLKQSELELHMFYASGAYDQFKAYAGDGTILNADSVGFAWSRMDFDASSGKVALNISKTNNNDFYIPQGFEEPLKFFHDSKRTALLNVYADRQFGEILAKSSEAVSGIIDGLNKAGADSQGVAFDGVIVDFEGLPGTERDEFSAFLRELKPQLNAINKKLYVAVIPEKYSSSYDYRAIGEMADRVILMAHDYDVKSLKSDFAVNGIVYTPLTPINEIREAMKEITNSSSGISDPRKVLLQINMASAQWKVKDGVIMDNDNNKNDGIVYPNRPTYDLISNRIMMELSSGKAMEDIVFFDENSRNPYISYYNNSDGTQNYIWYEDSRSVVDKIDLAKEYGIGGISLWRLGNIPDYSGSNEKGIYLDVWQQIIENVKSK